VGVCLQVRVKRRRHRCERRAHRVSFFAAGLRRAMDDAAVVVVTAVMVVGGGDDDFDDDYDG
jgi:hypothetical protein